MSTHGYDEREYDYNEIPAWKSQQQRDHDGFNGTVFPHRTGVRTTIYKRLCDHREKWFWSDGNGRQLDNFRAISPCHAYHDPRIRVLLDENDSQLVEVVLESDNHWHWCDTNGKRLNDEKLRCEKDCTREHTADNSYQGSF